MITEDQQHQHHHQQQHQQQGQTNPPSGQQSQPTQQQQPTPGSQSGSTTSDFEAKPSPSSAGDEYIMTNPFENTPRYEDDYDPPSLPSDQTQHIHQHQHHQQLTPQQQQVHPAQQQQQQQQQQYYHQGYYNQQWQQQQQHYGHPQQMYHQQPEYGYPQQLPNVAQHPHHQQTQYHHMYPPGHGYPHHHPASHGGQQTSPNGPANTATPSPTTNSDDSGGDCVTESKRLLLAGHPSHVSESLVAPIAQPYPGAMHYPHVAPPRGVPLVQKRPRQTRRNKKKRDPNEPQKPVSAYALFFRDMQAGIKARNPNASFGEVSKHVAAMWDNLNPDHKAAYKKRTENAKKEYLKQLAAYRANLVSKNHHHPDNPYGPYGAYFNKPNSAYDYSGAGNSLTGSDIRRHSPMGIPSSMESPSSISSEGGGVGGGGGGNVSNNNNVSGIGERTSVGYSSPGVSAGSNNAPNGPQGVPQLSPHHAHMLGSRSGPPGSLMPHPGMMHSPHHHYQSGGGTSGHHPGLNGEEANVCRRPGCTNTLLDLSMNGFCSNDCVLSQSRDVYNNWSGSAMGMGPGTPPQPQAAAAR